MKLLIDNEVELPQFLKKFDNLEIEESGSGGIEEPHAEARTQLDTSLPLHQFTNLGGLKILSPSEDPALKKKKHRVYSQVRLGSHIRARNFPSFAQDFKKMKILQIKPEIDNEIEQQTELYIRREDIFEVDTNSPAPDEGNILTTNTMPAPTNKTTLDYEIVIREGKETITLFPDTFHKLLNPSLQTTRNFPSQLDTTKLVSPFLHVTTAPPVAAPPADWREDIERKYPDVLDSNEIKEDLTAMESITDDLLDNLEDYGEYHADYRKVYSR